MKNRVKTAQSAHRPSKGTLPKNRTCQCAFAETQRQRVQCPLNSGGIYKLKEACIAFQQMLQTVRVIEQIVLGELRPAPHELVGDCVAEEKARWLKSVPKHVAETLGYNVLPAVEALGGDYLPNGRVQKLAQDARVQADQIVSRCDEVSAEICQSIEAEYSQMRTGRSISAKLLREAIDFVGHQIELAEKYRLKAIRSPSPAE